MPVVTRTITVSKRNPAGLVTWQYSGVVLKREADGIILEARFNLPDKPFLGIVIREGDRFIENYYTDRWYNILEIHDRDDDRLKGWYCNIGKPPVIESENEISYVDLALDLWVDSEGNQTVLDVDEFAALDLDARTRSMAWTALEELQNHFLHLKEPGLT
jgi:uncharacterized protein